MKILGVVGVVLISFFARTQNSFDFSKPMPPGSKQVTSVSKAFHGSYSSGQIDIDYAFDETGIYSVSTVFQSISRETIRESTKYTVRNGYIFGIAEADSLPCELQGEYYHFAVQFKEQLVGSRSKNILTKIDDRTYIINFEERGTYTPSRFTFNGKQLTIEHFTYSEATTAFDEIQLKKEHPTKELNYVTLSPSLEEWESLPMAELFENKLLFERR